MDYALAPSDDGTRVILHAPNCPKVRAQAAAGEMVATLIGCENEPSSEFERHDCLQEQKH